MLLLQRYCMRKSLVIVKIDTTASAVKAVTRTKVCTKCKQTKPTSEFYWKNRTRGIRQARCISCYSRSKGIEEYRAQLLQQGLKPCSQCGEIKPLSEFYKQRQYYSGRCKNCMQDARKEYTQKRGHVWKETRRNRYASDKEYRQKIRGRELYRKYKITQQEYDDLLEKQGGVCKICKQLRPWRGSTTLHVDHCHQSGRVRGLLCHFCNSLLGYTGEDIAVPRAAIEYLRE